MPDQTKAFTMPSKETARRGAGAAIEPATAKPTAASPFDSIKSRAVLAHALARTGRDERAAASKDDGSPCARTEEA